MKAERTLIFLLSAAALCCTAWDFNGIDSKKVLNYCPAPGRFAVTLAFQFTISKAALTPGNNKGTTLYPLVMQAVKPGKKDFSKLMMCFVTTPDNRYFFAAATPGGRYNINWSSSGSEIPTGKPVWFFLSAAAGGIFEARINSRNYSHVRGAGLVPLVKSAAKYRIYLGYNPYRKGVGFTRCKIENFMLFERVLDTEEMEQIEKTPSSAVNIPGYFPISEKN